MNKYSALSPAKLQELLENNWSKLVNVLEVERIIPKFREVQLFDRTDDEKIRSEFRNPTSVAKAGILLDTVVSRGPKAIQLLFDHVEKQHPDLYKEITGREPMITRARMKTYLSRQREKGLPPGLTLTILTQLSDMMEEKEIQEQELEQRSRDLEKQRLFIEKLQNSKKRMILKNEALKSKVEERDKMQTELDQRTSLLKDVQNKLLKVQREAEKAKHHARMATFKNFHLEYELREMHNRMSLQRTQTRHLQRSVKKHERWLNEHNISYTFDPKKVEELQRELEKIEDFRRSVAVSDEGCEITEISERVQNQLAQAKNTNESLNLKIQRLQEKNDGLKGEIDLLKNERKMMRDTMRMNRLHLEMSQQELEIVSRERAKINQAYEEVLKDMSHSFLTTSSLQDRLNKLRMNYADLSERIMNAGDGSVDTSGIHPHDDEEDELLDEDDSAADAEDNTESGGDDDDFQGGETIVPVTRPRLRRITSTGTSQQGCNMEKMRTLTESFNRGELTPSPAPTTSSSSTPTTGDESATNSLKIGKVSGFPSYSFHGSTDGEEEEEEEDDYDEEMAKRLSRLTDDFELVEHQTATVRSRPRTRRTPGLREHRRSRSLSRLEDYENMEFLKPAGCYRYDQSGVKGTPLHTPLLRENSITGQRSSSRVESWLLVSSPKTPVPKLRVSPLQAQQRECSTENETDRLQECMQPSEQWLGEPIEPVKPAEPRSKRIKNLSGILVMNRGSYRFGMHRKGGQKVNKNKEKQDNIT